ncbi:MAG: hypothetical protein V9F03_09550 [Microthrixaceae bacterium]
MRILLAPDKFRGTLDADGVIGAMSNVLRRCWAIRWIRDGFPMGERAF